MDRPDKSAGLALDQLAILTKSSNKSGLLNQKSQKRPRDRILAAPPDRIAAPHVLFRFIEDLGDAIRLAAEVYGSDPSALRASRKSMCFESGWLDLTAGAVVDEWVDCLLIPLAVSACWRPVYVPIAVIECRVKPARRPEVYTLKFRSWESQHARRFHPPSPS
jgi:hypothetical protein